MRTKLPTVLAQLLLCLAALPMAAGADWLVLRDGTEIETTGAWTVRGKLVVFTGAGGELASVRLDEVDLDRSRERTAQPASGGSGTASGETTRRASLVITDSDVRHLMPGTSADADAEATEDGEQAAESGAVSVTEWNEWDNPEQAGSEIRGWVHNGGDFYALSVAVNATVYDADGFELGQATASLGKSTLGPGQSTQFSARFPDVISFTNAQFEVTSDNLLGAGSEEEAAPAEGDEEAETAATAGGEEAPPEG